MNVWPSRGVVSSATPGVMHMSPSRLLAELVMINKYKPKILPPFFWNDCQYKEVFDRLESEFRSILKKGFLFSVLRDKIVENNICSINSNSLYHMFEDSYKKRFTK